MRKNIDDLCGQLTWADLDLNEIKKRIELARAEDLSGSGLKAKPAFLGDITTESLGIYEEQGDVHFVARESMTICGLHLIPMVLKAYGGRVDCELIAEDGQAVNAGEILASLKGDMKVVLQSERVMLNFIQHLSGISTEASRYVRALGDSKTRLLDTRKTTPGYRALEKYAARSGGAWNHRMGLYDRVMYKDNHWALCADEIETCIQRAKSLSANVLIEVEVDSMEPIEDLLKLPVDVLLLDNFDDAMLVQAVQLIAGRAWTEASGNITFERLPRLGKMGLDTISVGALTHQSRWVDVGLDILK